MIVLVATSVYLFSGVNFSMQFTNTKSDFSYQGATDKTTVTSYYASSGEYIGGASLEVEEGVFLDSAIVIFDNGIETIFNNTENLCYILALCCRIVATV